MSAYRSHTRILVEPYRCEAPLQPDPYRTPSPPPEPPWPTLEERGIYDYAKANARGQRYTKLALGIMGCWFILFVAARVAYLYEGLLRAFP